MSRYRAVVFDLWGTLVDELNHPEENRATYLQKTFEMADILRADRDKFASEWAKAALHRISGGFPSTEAALLHICESLGIEPFEDRVRASVRVRHEYVREALSPRPGVLETMTILRESGYRVGLISNCGDEVSRMWASTSLAPMFDAKILSFEVGLTKPDLRIYAMAAQQLGVPSKQCLYVGDGSDGELSGASNAGMTAVLIRAPYDRPSMGRQDWEGDTVSDVSEVLNLL